MNNLSQILVNGLLIGGVYALSAIGLTLVFGVMRVINFAHGEFLMLGGYASYYLFTLWGIDPILSIPLTILLVGPIGWLVQKYLVARVMHSNHLNQILLTLGISIILQNAALLLFTGDHVSAPVSYGSSSVTLGPVTVGVARLIAFGLGIGLSALLYMILTKTEVGRVLRAVAQNDVSARLMGINVEQIYLLTYVVSASLAAVSGALTSVIMYVHPLVGFQFIVKDFAIVVLGGLGSVPGAVLGALLLGVVESFVGTVVPNGGGWAEGISFVAIIVTLLIRPKGLFGVE
ncbi:MAG: ABC-type transporter, integral rane subunit [Firmicutes bacterium]|nr:ABC-type transporter, integral rane subunit [Bacillota bacterium]